MKSLAAALLVVLPASAQLTASVGPPKVPLNGELRITMSNHTSILYALDNLYPFSIQDTSGQPVFTKDAVSITLLKVNDVATFNWDLKNDLGVPVAPGDYVAAVELPDGSTSNLPFTVGGVAAGVALLGTPKLGYPRWLDLQAPGTGTSTYVLAASAGTSPGIPTCAGIVPLNPDGVFFASLDPASPIFLNFQGTMFGGGTEAPIVWIPEIPGLAGLQVSFAFVALDFALPCPVKVISGATTVKLVN